MNRRELLKAALPLLGSGMLAGCAWREASTASPGASAPIDATRFAALRKFVPTPFGEIACAIHGSGPAALFLHGFPLNSFQWRGALQKLSPYRTCLAPDFLGMGFTRISEDQDVAPRTQVLMLAALLDALRVDQVDLIANDSGGAVAQLFCVRYPARVRSLLLTNCDTERQSPPTAMMPVIELAKQGRFVDEWLAPWAHDATLARSEHGIGGLCYAKPGQPTDEALAMYFGPLLESAERRAGLHRYAIALADNSLAGIEADLRRSRIPVRVAWGMADGIFDASNADYLDAAFGNSRGVRRLPESKLFWPEERPDVIAAEARILWEHARR